MNLFNYLMARKGHNTSPRDDLFAYLLGKIPKVVKEVTGVTIHITNVTREKIISLWLNKESTQDGTPTPDNPIPVEVVEGYIKDGNNYVDVKVTGKNLFDKDNISLGYVNADGTLSSDNVYRTSDFISIQPNTAYYKTNTASPRTKYYDSNKQPLNTSTYQDISIGGSAGTFTTPNNARYLRFSFPSTGPAAVDVNSIMINEGSTATSYEPYQGSTVSIPLNGNFIAGIGDYKDMLIVDKFGKCYLNKKIGKKILNGSETGWNSVQMANVYGYYIQFNNILAPTGASGLGLGLSNYFSIVTPNQSWGTLVNNSNFSIINSANPYTFVRFTMGETTNKLVDFKSWLSTHNTDVYYVSAQEELIDLNYTVDLKLFIGENNISNSEDMMMTLKYY